MMKKVLVAFAGLFLLAALLVGCGASGAGGASGQNTVHLTANNFAQPSITISKGSSITLISDTGATHIISNGSWVNNTAKPAKEFGAPVVNNLMVNQQGESQTVGPFNTAGTFHLYCSVHPGMNLTVIVQ